MPFTDEEIHTSSCYVMPIMLEQDGRQAEVSAKLRERGIQTSIFYPSIHRFTAYRERYPGVSLPITELASRTELTLPFYPEMSHDDQDRVVTALAEVVEAMSDWRVPLTDVAVPEEDVQAVLECLESGWLTMGPRAGAFEQALSEFVGTPHAVTVSSGTAALHLACLAAGLGPGDEVIVPAFTFVASAAAPRYVGATPVLCDVSSPHEFTLDPADVARRITPRTKAVIAVHFCGYPARRARASRAVRRARARC